MAVFVIYQQSLSSLAATGSSNRCPVGDVVYAKLFRVFQREWQDALCYFKETGSNFKEFQEYGVFNTVNQALRYSTVS